MEKLYTVGEIAKELNIPESTASYYIRTFIEYMPVVGEGRRKRYKPEVLEIVAQIRQGFNNHLSQEQVSQLLEQKYGVNVESEKELQIYNSSLIEQQQVIKQMAATIVDLRMQIDEVRAEIRVQGSKVEELEVQANSHFKLVDERLRQVIEDKKKPWYKRLFS